MDSLFDPALLDELEGLNQRYALLSRRIAELYDDAAAFDQPPDRQQVRKYQEIQSKVKEKAVSIIKQLEEALTP